MVSQLRSRIRDFARKSRDIFTVAVWVSADGKGYITIENDNYNLGVSLAVAPPSGVTLVGNSVEWILERYAINNQLQRLPDYFSVVMKDCLALTYTTPNQMNKYFPGLSPTGTIYDITMLSDSGNPESTAYLVPFDPNNPGTLAFIANK
jgi:hypothetical protein